MDPDMTVSVCVITNIDTSFKPLWRLKMPIKPTSCIWADKSPSHFAQCWSYKLEGNGCFNQTYLSVECLTTPLRQRSTDLWMSAGAPFRCESGFMMLFSYTEAGSPRAIAGTDLLYTELLQQPWDGFISGGGNS